MKPVEKERLAQIKEEGFSLIVSNSTIFLSSRHPLHRLRMRLLNDVGLRLALAEVCRDARVEREKTGGIARKMQTKLVSYVQEAERRLKKARNHKIDRLYQLVELASFLLPRQARLETFEPSYNDLKGDFLKARQRYKGKWARRWLAGCFTLHSFLIIGNCFWLSVGEKGRRIILWLLPDAVKRFLGG